MRPRFFVLVITAVGLFHTRGTWALAPGEGLILNPSTGDYTLNYCDPDQLPDTCVIEQVIFTPATKLSPVLRTRFILNTADWSITYRYRVKNKAASRQPLVMLALDPIPDINAPIPLSKRLVDLKTAGVATQLGAGRAVLLTPAGWQGTTVPSVQSPNFLRLGWTFGSLAFPQAGLAPGQVQLGFGFTSTNLPGIAIAAQLSGNPERTNSFDDDGPTGDIGAQFNALQLHDYVTSVAAVPTVAIPMPFGRAELLRRIDAQMKTWVDLKLLDPTLLPQLDGYIQAAITAASVADLTSCAADVASVRNRLLQIYALLDDLPDEWTETADSPLIAKLAARVLYFDLGYAISHP